MLVHHAAAFRHRDLIPVLVLPTLAVHGVETEKLGRRDLRIEARSHGSGLAREDVSDLGVPLRGVRLQAALGQCAIRLCRRLIQPELHNRYVGVRRFQIFIQA